MIRCNGCGAKESIGDVSAGFERARRLEGIGWDWYTGYRKLTTYWCPRCKAVMPDDIALDRKDAMTPYEA